MVSEIVFFFFILIKYNLVLSKKRQFYRMNNFEKKILVIIEND